MTRINLICPSELSRQHLIAEYRELPRIFGQASAAWDRGDRGPFPEVYTLGKGHVRFFYDKLLFLFVRQITLIKEMKDRGYRPTFDATELLDRISNTGSEWFKDYTPTPEALAINRHRILERSPPVEAVS